MQLETLKAASHMLCIGYGHAPPQCLGKFTIQDVAAYSTGPIKTDK